jgi:UDP-N-acetylmuramyl pentapeptide phosphotransferase/UDP-N-acetylglucosamine-1-phosphate transferase
VFASLIALPLAPALLRRLAETGHVRANYRGRELPCPLGVLPVAAALIAILPLELLQRLGGSSVLPEGVGKVALYAIGVAFLGLVDDMFGEGARGWRGHAAATMRRTFSTGLLKAVGALALALYVTAPIESSNARWLLASAVLVLGTNAFNLLDLRPGRASKAFALLGAGLTLGAWSATPLWTVGAFAGPGIVAGVYDLRERAMLGDTGANLLGGLAGWWLVLTLSAAGQLVALALLALLTVYGELRSISSLVERTPGLRELDSWGRPIHR